MKKKILILSSTKITFIRQDEQLLKKYFDTRTFHLERTRSRLHSLKNYLQLVLWLAQNIRNCDALFVVFADVHAFFMALFSRVFKKKLFVVVGGFDATWIPEAGYGTYHKKRPRFFSHFTFKTATRILPVCESLKRFGKETRGDFHITQGVTNLYPDIPENKITVVPNGYRTEFFKPAPEMKEPATVLMVAAAGNPVAFKIKGIDLLVRLSEQNPEWSFSLAGIPPTSPFFSTPIPANLRVIPYLEHEELLKEFQRSKIILSLSLTEGMPNAVCEGMLCECVPVGFPVGAIAEIIGDTGIVLSNRGLDEIQAHLEQALTMDGKRARQRIIDHFPLKARSQALYKIIEQDIENLA